MNSGYVTLDVMDNKFPCEGPKVIPLGTDFFASPSYSVDLKSLVQQNKISNIQSLFVDNSANNSTVNISVSVQNQTIIIPPYSQAYIMLLCNLPQLQITSAGAVNVPIFALNFPVTNCVWSANSAGVAPSVNVANFPALQPVSVSANSAQFSTSGIGANLSCTDVSASIAIAPTVDQTLRLVNTGANIAYVRLTSGASTALLTDLAIVPNGSIILNPTGFNTLSGVCASTQTATINAVLGTNG